MTRRPPRSTRPDTLFPYPTLFRSLSVVEPSPLGLAGAVDLKAVWPWDVVRPEVVTRHDQSSSGSDFRVIQTPRPPAARINPARRSEEHTSELQSLMRISYAVLCLKKKKHENKKSTVNTSNAI